MVPTRSSCRFSLPRRFWAPSIVTAILALSFGATNVEAQDTPPESESPGLIHDLTDVHKDLVRPPRPEARLRAISRLGAAKSQRALDQLVLAVSANPSPPREGMPQGKPAVALATDGDRGRERIALAHALGAYVERPEARRALARLMAGSSGSAEPEDTLAAGIAATTLARAGTPDAIETLGRALGQSAALDGIAKEALLAYPPLDLAVLLRAAPMTRSLIELLTELGDQRAFLPLREVVRTGAPALRGPAAFALFRLGALETVPYARHAWRKSRIPTERLFALRILAEAGDPEAKPALAAVLSGNDPLATLEPNADAIAVELAARAPEPEWRPLLIEKTESGNVAIRENAFLALARLETSAEFFDAALASPSAASAAHALALTSTAAHDAVLRRALGAKKSRAWALRALGVRLARGRSESMRAAFDASVATALSSAAPEERAAAAWSLSLVEPSRAASHVSSKDSGVVRATARQAFRGQLAVTFATELSRTKPDDLERIRSLSPCLLDGSARAALSTRTLERLAKGAEPAIFAAIASRSAAPGPLPNDEHAAGPSDVERWLASADDAVRAAVARGLGDARDGSSVGLLSQLYLFEPEAPVRRAAIAALLARSGSTSTRVRTLASRIDPDSGVRALARGASPGRAWSSESPHSLTWVADAKSPLRLTSAWGESILVFPDPDGFVGVLDFGPEPIERGVVSEGPVAKAAAPRDPSKEKREP